MSAWRFSRENEIRRVVAAATSAWSKLAHWLLCERKNEAPGYDRSLKPAHLCLNFGLVHDQCAVVCKTGSKAHWSSMEELLQSLLVVLIDCMFRCLDPGLAYLEATVDNISPFLQVI